MNVTTRSPWNRKAKAWRLAALVLSLGFACGAGRVDAAPAWKIGESVDDVEDALRSAASSGSGAAQADYIRFLNAQGRPEEAAQALQGTAGIGDSLATLLAAEAAYYQGNTEKARAAARDIAPAQKPEWIAARELLIRMEFLEGHPNEARTICQDLLTRDPHNRAARLFLARVQGRFGEYADAIATLDAAAIASPDDLEILEVRACLLDAEGETSDALTLRRSLIARINAAPPPNAEGMVAAAEAMRLLHEPFAANQCLQLAERYWPADPYVILEKIRLVRETYGFDDAAVTVKRLTKRFPHCALAIGELVEVLSRMRKSPTQVSGACAAALAMDPTLLAPRNRLAFYDAVTGDWEEATRKIDENRKHNPRDLETERMARAVSLLRQGAWLPLGDDGRETTASLDVSLSLLMGDLLTAREDYQSAAAWFRFVLDRDPDNRAALRNAGHAAFRTGQLEDAAVLLERSFQRNRYDFQTKNTLDLLDTIRAGTTRNAQAANSPPIVVGLPPKAGAALAGMAANLALRSLTDAQSRLGLSASKPLRLQLCDQHGDIPVAAEGVAAFGCGSCSSGVLGGANFDSIAFLWTPKGAGGLDRRYRFDEAISRGVALHVLRSLPPGRIPLWMREGLAGYVASCRNPEWTPDPLAPVIAFIRLNPLPLAQLDAGYIGEAHPLCRVYGWMVVREWAELHGEESIRALLARLGKGEDWKTAAVAVYGKPLDVLDSETRNAILDRYRNLRLPAPLPCGPDALVERAKYSDPDKILLCEMYINQQRYDDARLLLQPFLDKETPTPSALFLAGRLAQQTGEYAAARDRIRLGLQIQTLRGETLATDEDYLALGIALRELGKPDEAVEALLLAVRCNPYDDSEHGAFGTLLELLKTQEPRPAVYYEVLEQRMPGRRNDADLRLELAQWQIQQGQKEKAFHTLQSAAGLQPTWIAIHRILAPLALELNDPETAYWSYRAMHETRPRDVAILKALARCAELTGRVDEQQDYQRQLPAPPSGS